MGRKLHERTGRPQATKVWVFILIATCLMVLMDRVFTGSRIAPETVATEQAVNDIVPSPHAAPEPAQQGLPEFAPPLELSVEDKLLPVEDKMIADEKSEPQWRRNAVPSLAPKDAPRVVIIIDDMGMDRVHTREATMLPGPVTFAFLPYADDLEQQTKAAREGGHELIVHVPMEPMNGSLDAGPEVLRPSMPPDEFMRVLEDGLTAFDSYVGINNHMGSRMTQDREGMRRVMGALKEKGLLFVDSKTIGTSVAEDEAEKAGIPHAGRDVFLDHDESYEAVSAALAQTERKALKDGLAIAIGHPKRETIRALREWLPTLEEKGIFLIPVSAAVTVPAAPEEAVGGD